MEPIKNVKILDKFDIQDEKNLGRPLYFSLEKFIETIEMFIRSDELQTAVWLCDNPPAWYREHYPPELAEIKSRLYQQCYDIFLYGNDDDEANQTIETCVEQWQGGYCVPRAQLITEEVKRLNSEGKTPWIFDLSCSHGNLPIGLRSLGVRFDYLGKSMNHRAAAKVKEWLGPNIWQQNPEMSVETILVCTEALEHAWDPQDIVRAAYKTGIPYDQIFLSTPLGCLGGGLDNWRDRPLGHVRGWTPQEFTEFAMKAWPGYQWTLYRSHSMVLHGKRNT